MRLPSSIGTTLARLRAARPRTLALGLAFAATATWAGGATWYIVFRDDVLAGLTARQGAMQYAYEERLGALKVRLERLTSQRLLDAQTVEGRLADLARRQAALTSRQAAIDALAEQVSEAPRAAGPLPEAATAYAPVAPSGPTPLPAAGAVGEPADVPAPLGLGLRGGEPEGRQSSLAPLAGRTAALARALDDLGARQGRAVGVIVGRATQRAGQLKAALAEAGLALSRFERPAEGGVGGPYVPVSAGAFEGEMALAQRSLSEVGRLVRLAGNIPLQRPTRTDLGVSSPFGYRSDPFTRGLALHTGTDLRAEYGTPARATAGGRVVSAEYSGGYGNMVEIDHGYGLVTRYAHLAAFAVAPGERVTVGQVVGRVGSTGRSTGAHLHYEVRIDGEPVDPQRFLRAGARLFGPALMAAR